MKDTELRWENTMKSWTWTDIFLSEIIDCVKFCGSFELALQGYDEMASSDNPGMLVIMNKNWMELKKIMVWAPTRFQLDLAVEGDTSMTGHVLAGSCGGTQATVSETGALSSTTLSVDEGRSNCSFLWKLLSGALTPKMLDLLTVKIPGLLTELAD